MSRLGPHNGAGNESVHARHATGKSVLVHAVATDPARKRRTAAAACRCHSGGRAMAQSARQRAHAPRRRAVSAHGDP